MKLNKKLLLLFLFILVAMGIWYSKKTEGFQVKLEVIDTTNDEAALLPKDYLTNPRSLTTQYCANRKFYTTPPCETFCHLPGNNCNLRG